MPLAHIFFGVFLLFFCLWTVLLLFTQKNVIIFYDGSCGFCYRGVVFLRLLLILPWVKIKTIQSQSDVLELSQQHNSWVIFNSATQQKHFGFQGFKKIIALSPLWFWTYHFWQIPVISKLGEKLYRSVANNRSSSCSVK